MEELQTIKNRNLTSCSKSLLTYVNNWGCEQEYVWVDQLDSGNSYTKLRSTN